MRAGCHSSYTRRPVPENHYIRRSFCSNVAVFQKTASGLSNFIGGRLMRPTGGSDSDAAPVPSISRTADIGIAMEVRRRFGGEDVSTSSKFQLCLQELFGDVWGRRRRREAGRRRGGGGEGDLFPSPQALRRRRRGFVVVVVEPVVVVVVCNAT